MEHIVITAGGTAEAIDGVRQLSNTSTGSLAARIYGALAEYPALNADGNDSGYAVHYVVSKAAVRPEPRENLPVTFYPVTDVESVESVLGRLLKEYKIGYVIHAMAVSDFTKDYLIDREALIGELADTLDKAFAENGRLSGEALRALISDVLARPVRRLDDTAKAPSTADLLLSLKRTPKLIEMIKRLSPETFLVGFKLLRGVSEEVLIDAGAGLAETNGCDLVLANDLNSIKDGRHEGLLLQGRRVVGRYGTKEEIAAGIAAHLLGGGDKAVGDGR